jgi:NAD-dependent dihydropyrimidine dehydrogenase PreA subunit
MDVFDEGKDGKSEAVNAEACEGCESCVATCEEEAITLEGDDD